MPTSVKDRNDRNKKLKASNTFDSASIVRASHRKQMEKVRNEKETDVINNNKFLDQDLLNPNIDGEALYTPEYKRNKKFTSDQEAMLGLFNQRKDEILANRAMPGISQTRF